MKFRNSWLSYLQAMLIIVTSIGELKATSIHRRELDQHLPKRIHLPRAIDAARRFSCREPQSRSYNLQDLMERVELNPGESANLPVYVILKRCDSHAGCCFSPDLSCMPVKSEMYHEELEIEVWNLETNKTRRQWIRVVQHGRCACDEASTSKRHHHDHEHPGVSLL